MSGVEAVFGVVAGGASFLSLAIQLAETATKLNRLYHSAKNAPQTVARLVFSLETMAMALKELEQHRQHDRHSGALLERCMMECYQSTGDVRRAVDKMELHMAKYGRTVGKIYSVFKEQEVKELLDDLERAKSSLELAYMMYMGAEQRRRDQVHDNLLARQGTLLSELDAQVSVANTRLSEQLALLRGPPGSSSQPALAIPYTTPATLSNSAVLYHETSSSLPTKPVKQKKDGRHLRFTFRLPTWLCARIWDLEITSAQCRRSMHLRTYSVIHMGSPIFKYCASGDIASMQRLFENGQATPLDVKFYSGDYSLTLIEQAARHGQLEVCQFLLSQTTWPDQAALLSSALGYYAANHSHLDGEETSQMYRFFMGSPDFEADLDDEEVRYGWLDICAHKQCLDLILETQLPGFFNLPTESRFEFAVRVGTGSCMDPSGFLHCIQLPPSDTKLATLRSRNGISVLHYVAQQLSNLMHWRSPHRNELNSWFEIGVAVLKNGVNPCCIARDRGQRFTPLRTHLDARNGTVAGNIREFERKLKALLVWASMLQEAGLSLCEYGARESRAWESLGIQKGYDPSAIPYNGAILGQLVYGPEPSDWSLTFRNHIHVPVYKLHPLPGAFTKESHVPKTITWPPTEDENDEGPWELVGSKDILTEPIDIRDALNHEREPFLDLVDSTQDDTSIITLMQYRAARTRNTASRSHSQPPPTRRREVAHYGAQESSIHHWLGCYHLCLFNFRWQFGCGGAVAREYGDAEWASLRDGVRRLIVCLRICFNGTSNRHGSVQESDVWEWQSFLSDIRHCQDNEGTSWFKDEMIGHTGTQDCPWNCAKVHLDQLRVPEPLRRTHPRRRYGNVSETG